MRSFTLVALILLCLSPLLAQVQSSPEITAAELRQHLMYIASDELAGRKAGSEGADRAAQYIAEQFKSYGLSPAGSDGSYLQPFEFVAGVEPGPGNRFSAMLAAKRVPLAMDEDIRPLGFSSSGSFAGNLVFAGYGISATEQSYDDYVGIDVKDAIVMLFRYHPEGGAHESEFQRYSALRYKAAKAKELGAKAMILVTGPADSDDDVLMKLAYDRQVGNAGIGAVSVTRAVADGMLKSSGWTVGALQDSINATKQPQSFVVENTSLDLSIDLKEIRSTSSNVLGLLEGSDEALKNEVVVVGAHYDHLGMGGPNSGSLMPDTVAPHNGADDNGSGTVGLLELAQSFAAKRPELKRSMLFIAFTGEELGLLGSAHFVNNPTVELARIVTMANMDMIGRLTDRKLIVYGVGTSPGFEELIQKHNADSTFDLRPVKDGFGPSDQSSFYGKEIPVFHFFTDLHSDYHRPGDDVEMINYDGMTEVLRFVEFIVMDVNTLEQKPLYAKVEMPSRPTGGMGRSRSYTGTIPDFGGGDVVGMKISGVRDGGPAAKAGLEGGDIIVKFGAIEIKNLYDYTYALGEYKPGDEVEVVVKRGEETVTLKLTIGKRN
jgi:hypothetical protein